MTNVVRVMLSILLSLATLAGISALSHLPYSSARDAITDFLSLPGGLIAWLFYSGGVHSGHASAWAFVAIAGNLAFYALAWFFALLDFQSLQRRMKRARSVDS